MDAKDIVARFGGEEFCIILKDMSASAIKEKLESIRKKVENSSFKDHDTQISFTVSIGVVTSAEDTLEETINTADMFLYNAKNGGRNQVVSD